jgi:hypothetical protein
MRITKLLLLVLGLTMARGAHAEPVSLTAAPAKLEHDGKVKVINGAILVGTGVALAVAGSVVGATATYGDLCREECVIVGRAGGVATATVGAASAAVGLPLLISGKSELNKAARLRVQAAPYASATGAGGTLRLTF